MLAIECGETTMASTGQICEEAVKDNRSGFGFTLFNRMRTLLIDGLSGMGQTRAGRRLALLETLRLGGKCQLLLVACDGQHYLVGLGGDSVHSIVAVQSSSRGITDGSTARAFSQQQDCPCVH